MRRRYKILIALIILSVIFYVGFSFLVASLMTGPMSPKIDVTARLVSENFEDVSFSSTDGLTLKGWWFKTDSDKLIIVVHGLIPNRTNIDYYGMWVAEDLVNEGYNVILFDLRAHGKSQGSRNSYGNNEGKDILGAIKFAESKGFNPENIGIIGVSTGAIATLNISPELSEIGALVIDTAASNYKPIIVDRLWKEKFVPPIFAPGIFFFTDTVFGLGISDVKPIEKLKEVPERRFLFLHGGQDETFPIMEAEKLLETSNPESKLVIFPDGEHIETFKSDPDLYRHEVFNFLEAELGN